MKTSASRSPTRQFELAPGSPVIVHLQAPREKVWGLLLELLPAVITVRAIDLTTFEDWLRQEARGEEQVLGLTTLFYPMSRVEKMERDETVGPVPSYCDRFEREVGRTVRQALGLDPLE